MDSKKAVDRQRKFFDSGRTKDYSFRRTALLKLLVSLDKYEGELCKALYKDLRKSSQESIMTEIGLVKKELKFHLKHLREWMSPKRVPTPFYQFPAKSFTLSEPYGVVLIMAPWNYPVLLCLEPLISAIAAGNCVILKPSAYAPEVSKILAKMLGEIYPAKFVLTAVGGRQENDSLLMLHFDKIFFTGGKDVGALVLERAAKHLTPVTLELGGKNPCIIDKKANLKLAARRIAFGKILNSGQTCVAPDYLLIHESVKEEFLNLFGSELDKMLGHRPLENHHYPAIVNEKHYQRIMELIQGEKTFLGGYGDVESLKIAPTVLEDITLDSPVMKEEIFGPLLPILTYHNKKDILKVVRHFHRPLACYVFTRDREMVRFVLRNISFGGGCINDTIMHLATPYMGFGGVGHSGMGAYHGKTGFDCFSHSRSIMKQSDRLDIPVRYHPYKQWKEQLTRLLLLL